MKKINIIMIVLLTIVAFMTPIDVKANEKDMKEVDLAEYRDANIKELKKIVKLTKDKKKKNRYYDARKTTYITTDKSGHIIKITIKGTSKKAQKYAPRFGGVALAYDGIMADNFIESEDKVTIYENPYTAGDSIEDEDEDYIMYAQELNTYNTITVKSKLLKWHHSDKKIYQITWKKNGVTSKNMKKYSYHDVDAENAQMQADNAVKSLIEIPNGVHIPVPTDTIPPNAIIENNHIWVSKDKVLDDSTNYLGKRAMFRGIIQKSADGRMELSNINSYTTEVTALYNNYVYTQLPTTPIYDVITTVWGVIIDANEKDGITIILDTIFATGEPYPSNLEDYHTIDEVRNGNGYMDMVKVEGTVTVEGMISINQNSFYIKSDDGTFYCSNSGFGKVNDYNLIGGRKFVIYGKLDVSDGIIEVAYMEPII